MPREVPEGSDSRCLLTTSSDVDERNGRAGRERSLPLLVGLHSTCSVYEREKDKALSERSLSVDGDSVAAKHQNETSPANETDSNNEEDERGEKCSHSSRHEGLTRGQRSLARKLELKEARKNRRVSRRALTPLHYAAGALDVDETLRLLSIAAEDEENTIKENGSSGSTIQDMLLAVDVSDSTPLHHATILQRVRVDPWRVDKAALLSRSALIVKAILDAAKRRGRWRATSSLQHNDNSNYNGNHYNNDGKADRNMGGATTTTSTLTCSRIVADSVLASSVVLARDRMGRTALHLSAGYCDGDHIRLLISALSADTHTTDTCSCHTYSVCTPSSSSLSLPSWPVPSSSSSSSSSSLLCRSFASIDPKDDTGKTPLMEAAKTGNVEALAALIREGADVSSVDNKGKTALDYCEAFLFTNTMMLEKKRHHQRQQALYQQYQHQQQPQGDSSTPSLPGHVGTFAAVAGPDRGGLEAETAFSSSPPLPPQSLTSFIHRPHDDEDKLVDSIARGTLCVDMLKDAGGEERALLTNKYTCKEVPNNTKATQDTS